MFEVYQFECRSCLHYWNTNEDIVDECPECRAPKSDLNRYPEDDGETEWEVIKYND